MQIITVHLRMRHHGKGAYRTVKTYAANATQADQRAYSIATRRGAYGYFITTN